MKFNTQVCTNREQSERLLALGLKKETADCHHWYAEGKWYTYIGEPSEYNCIPAWSLHRLIALCPEQQVDVDNRSVTNHLVYNNMPWYHSRSDNLYDNLVDCIEWLIKENHFNKQYLNENL